MARVLGMCPTIDAPIKSKDGYLIRFRPKYGYLSSDQLSILADATSNFGSDFIELTSRANITMRGLQKQHLDQLSNFLKQEGIVNTAEKKENIANIIYSPFPSKNKKLAQKIINILEDNLDNIPKPHKKFGIAVDLGTVASLQRTNADLRIEIDKENRLLLRIDGSEHCIPVEPNTLIKKIETILNSAVATSNKTEDTRLINLIEDVDQIYSPDFKPRKQNFSPRLGPCFGGYMITVPGGKFSSYQLRKLALHVKGVAVTPWKSFFIDSLTRKPSLSFLSKNIDHDLSVGYCSGAPYCSQGVLDTSKVAKMVTAILKDKYKHKRSGANIHICGCLKNCGLSKQTSILINSSQGEKSISSRDDKFQYLASEISMELNK